MRKPPQQTPVAFKSGPVSVSPRPNGTWLFYWRDGGIRTRVAGPACSLNQAQALAAKVGQAVLNHRMGLGGADPSQLIHGAAGREFLDPHAPAVLTVRDALLEAIQRGSRASSRVLHHHRLDANRFMAWLSGLPKHPLTWEQVNRRHFADYLDHLEKRGLSGYRIANAFKPLRLAARYWDANAPDRFRDWTKGLRLPAGKAKSDPAPLSANQAVAFLARVEAVQPALAPVYALALAGGLRFLEAASVRLRDLDLTHGTVTVADTPWHSVKTHASKRTVPVPAYGLAIVRRYGRARRPTCSRRSIVHECGRAALGARRPGLCMDAVTAPPGRARPSGGLHSIGMPGYFCHPGAALRL